MDERISSLRTYIFDRHHHSLRRTLKEVGLDDMAERFSREGLPIQLRAALRLKEMLAAETPVLLPGETLAVTRTIDEVPAIYTDSEWKEITDSHYIHEKGDLCNISADYNIVLAKGLRQMMQEAVAKLEEKGNTEEQTMFYESQVVCLNAIRDFVKRYAQEAEAAGEEEMAETLRNISGDAPQTLREALQLLRVVHFCLWEAGHYHNTLGRFDQYIYPYYIKGIEDGSLTDQEAFLLIEEFFLSCNKDSDLYPGMQQGDNGQSLVLGGRNQQGECLFNKVSRMCLEASYELNLIDPKINLRVDANTPEEIFTLGSRLTERGLGFPQYSNDDVVIPGLVQLGYSEEDAHNYVVAACWEFIIPGVAVDIPNIDALPLAECVKAAMQKLGESESYDSFFAHVREEMDTRVKAMAEKERNLYIVPAPMMSLLMDGTMDKGRDVSLGSRYNNYAFHGTGIATAVDSLAALKKWYYDEHRVTAEEMLRAVGNDFVGQETLQEMLRKETEKFGQDVDWVDDIATSLLDAFADSLTGLRNERGGIYRAGTGTAMYYIFHAKGLGATADGRKSSEMMPANYSPSLFIDEKGPLSVIKSFAKPHLSRVINGGPLTLEFDQGIFRNDEAIEKLGQLVRTFIVLGGHQLQLNTISLDTLLDAKAHPERHRNLIVRVWGWSGYFVELDECYQDHVINRIRYKGM